MAPPDQNKQHKPDGGGDGDGDGDDDRAHPCDGSGGGSSASAVDQDHKACDEHTQGESVTQLFSSCRLYMSYRYS